MSKTDETLIQGLTEEEQASLKEYEDEQLGLNFEEDDDDEGTDDKGVDDEGTNDKQDDGVVAEADDADTGDTAGSDDDVNQGNTATDEPVTKDANQADPVVHHKSKPLLVAEMPHDFQTQMNDIDARKEEIDTKFEDGEISAVDYRREYDKLNKEERKLERLQMEAEIAQKMQRQQEANDWSREVTTFLNENPIFSETRNPRMFQALDSAVRDIASKEPNLTGRQVLEKAKAELIGEIQSQFKPTQPAESKPATAAKPKVDLPPTLNDIPSANVDNVDTGRFAHLDRLAERDPERYEREVAKLSESDREAYLAS